MRYSLSIRNTNRPVRVTAGYALSPALFAMRGTARQRDGSTRTGRTSTGTQQRLLIRVRMEARQVVRRIDELWHFQQPTLALD
jgi:hypothetical protein